MWATTIDEPARKVPLYGEYEVVVLGGGPAGIVAAAAAARAGRKTLLIERYGFLGGMGTAAGVTNFCGLHGNVHGEHRRLVQGLASELLARIDRLNGLNAPHLILGKVFAQAYDTAAYKIAADQLLASHKVNMLFHALGASVVMADERRIDAMLIETKAGRQAVRAEIFIDCSGDGDLAVWAGAPFEIGDEHGHPLYPSMMLRLNGIDPAKAGEAWRTIPQLMEKAVAAGTHRFPRRSAIVRPQKSGIEWRVNFTQVAREDGHAINGIEPDDLTRGEIEGRKQALAAYEFLRSTVPGFEKSYIVDLPPQLGIRETRRIKGGYQLSGEDVLGCASFADSIGVNGWPIEAHVPGDVVFTFPPIPESRGYNELPYRMLVPEGVDNLLVAGRCASMTHEGQSAARVSGACFAMGEAAGSAAALALSGNRIPREIPIEKLQETLKQQGAFIGRDQAVPEGL
ncbi:MULTISPECIES: FAD-dependent oxidoreductase [unclassified Bradyrhizobium]|uniref:FAD-dependent oxidoreductase n=1 Tax=unclassified Bradyrhizobium TaxID=2631580 RepID=UPI001CD530B9|nr:MULTISPECIES: FAD-dependent oxidoreductase [unclassified Bradyrhizobium]MCA1383091.1 FAD-dependent oxidoreductase [Bradyrhizobium sp. BRP05]MCA1362995.1 FAD-dependent oxidoreductase [Bradyrhizobium sp. IC4059]MCA1423434.1 FAD-dependent oxidoreductase [Bradyrhizobium sp. BRP23]MCA1437585.1 FAD-dependent oxidoreductase [Bradyrhizobium sp. BRP20]MCA1499353.1 FAD-dependent oxidoreductase [Bradyrhizobium sp. NBAIM14]